MSQEPFSARLASLVQRARKATRMYASIERSASGGESSNEEKESQAREWRVSNEVLLNRIANLMGVRPVTAVTPREVTGILHQFEGEADEWSGELSAGQDRLVAYAEAADYISTARLARDLVSLKARSQAANAILHELKTLLAPHAARNVQSSNRVDQINKGVASSPFETPSTPRSSEAGEHRFIAQRIKATMAGESTAPSPGGISKADSAAKKVVPLRRMTGDW